MEVRFNGLNVPEDVEIQLRFDGEVNFIFHSQKAEDKIRNMTEVEKYKFAVAITAKSNINEIEAHLYVEGGALHMVKSRRKIKPILYDLDFEDTKEETQKKWDALSLTTSYVG